MSDAQQPTPSEIATEYFARIHARDVSVVDLFHDDARLTGVGAQRNGRAAILDFYSRVIERAGPVPRLVGGLLVDGGRVAAEIVIDLAGGFRGRAVDVFETEAGRIRSLTYFIAKERGSGSRERA